MKCFRLSVASDLNYADVVAGAEEDAWRVLMELKLIERPGTHSARPNGTLFIPVLIDIGTDVRKRNRGIHYMKIPPCMECTKNEEKKNGKDISGTV